MTRPDLAQITVKRDFRLVGGGNLYLYDLFDAGTGVEFESEIPEPTNPYGPHLVQIGTIGPDLFASIVSTRISMDVRAGDLQQIERVDPQADHQQLIERIDSSLLGAPLLARVDEKGGLRINPTASDSLAPNGIQRVKLRQLYDTRERTMYRAIAIAEEPCIAELRVFSVGGKDLTTFDRSRTIAKEDVEKIHAAQLAIEPAVETRPDDFLYGEICGLHVSRDVHWNARYIGALKGFEEGTWYRPPGRMALLVKLGGLVARSDEIEVSAGKQYVGLYDPYSRSIVVEALD